MRWDNVKRVLRRRYADKKVWQSRATNPEIPGAAVLTPAKSPVDLHDLLGAIADTDDEADEVEYNGAWSVFEDRGWLETFLDFEWTGAGPPSWGSQLQLLSLGEPSESADLDDDWEGFREYVCWYAEEQPYVVVAALAPRAHRRLVEAFFLDFLRQNAEPYGVQLLFGALPTMTVNCRPDLISADTVKKGYLEWMGGYSARNRTAWVELRDRLINHPSLRDKRPTSVDDLKPAFAGDESVPVVERIRGYLGKQEKEDANLDEADRQLIFDNFFAVSYVERPGRGKKRQRETETDDTART